MPNFSECFDAFALGIEADVLRVHPSSTGAKSPTAAWASASESAQRARPNNKTMITRKILSILRR
jgi:hypothetical protein